MTTIEVVITFCFSGLILDTIIRIHAKQINSPTNNQFTAGFRNLKDMQSELRRYIHRPEESLRLSQTRRHFLAPNGRASTKRHHTNTMTNI